MPTRRKRLIAADDLYRFRLITDCHISPDGQHVVYCLLRVDKKAEKKYSNVWIVPTGGGRPRQFTYGNQVDSQPQWSPDGKQIAFLSNRVDEKQFQMFVISFNGGEARPLTDLKGTFASLQWSPRGNRILCAFQKKDREAIEQEKDQRKKELGIVSRHITRVFYKRDGQGFLPRERWHIWIIDARTGKTRQLTHGDVFDEWSPCWSPDAGSIVFCSNRSDDPDLEPEAIDLYVLPVSGGDPRRIETPIGFKASPTFSPDGQLLAYFGREGLRERWRNVGVWVVPAKGWGEARNLTGTLDFCATNWTINDLSGLLPMDRPVWTRDGKRLYFHVTHRGNTVLDSANIDGDEGNLQTIIGDPGVVGSFSLDSEQRHLAYFHADMADPGQVFIRDMATGRSRKLTHVNENLLRNRELGEFEEVWFNGGGDNNLHGWILKPPDFDESRRYPSILEIHGGPMVQYGNSFMHEFYYLAANGYVVYFCNPRGARGYGEEHARAIWNNWGTVDYDDVMAWADFVQRKPYIDAHRMGVTGGSYGGFMTNWIIGHTGRFRAAVTQRSVSNLISMYGSSDFNWMFQFVFGDEPPWENFENYWRQSPMKYMGNASTPTLVIHSEQDMRCAMEQGEQVFVALKTLGVETELVTFPGEPHGLSRGGRTDRRVQRLKHILRWFDRHLKEDGK